MSRRSSGSRGSGKYEEVQLPNSRSVKALIYFCGRDPRKAKSVRRYHDEDFDARSTGSGGSMFSWSSGPSQVYLVESTAPYWYWDDQESVSASHSSRKRISHKKGRTSRTPQRNQPTSTWARPATVEDDDDFDDSSSDGSFENYGGQQTGPRPGMMPGGMPPPGPPPGAFQPMPGGPQYPQHAAPRSAPPRGFQMPPPPPNVGRMPPPPPMAGGMPPAPRPGGMPPPPPPPPGGHFVPGRGGIQVFMDG
ncbi:hypothetical protein C8A00DRAFT_42847 [Chaetomidium leptoderma]|uniref:Uncharacterized protein n=1 Tax=Chaetomidium leptoderma TaxID=669021 RepID=A0AAN6VQ55_9PEZI|nr:hypothetical protein C8A00DRAFT_42847 [Chaetomidium leptoderma]